MAVDENGTYCPRKRVMSVLLMPAMFVSSLVARQRAHARRQLAASSPAEAQRTLCTDPDSHLTEASRLLSKLRELGIDVHGANHPAIALPPVPPAHAPEVKTEGLLGSRDLRAAPVDDQTSRARSSWMTTKTDKRSTTECEP